MIPRTGDGRVGIYIGDSKVVAAGKYTVGISPSHTYNDRLPIEIPVPFMDNPTIEIGHMQAGSTGDTVYRRYVGP